MPTHIPWGSINLFHNIIRCLQNYAQLDPEQGGFPLPTITYRGKVKLHGTNCAVQVTDEGLVAQSRECILTPTSDYKGFAKWVQTQESVFKTLERNITIFGEWCGPGIERGMAVSTLPNKIFAVFAIQVGTGADAFVVYDPNQIRTMVHGQHGPPENLYVLPYLQNFEVTIDFASEASLQNAVPKLNALVTEIETQDPWIYSQFGVTGLGEGVVLYPVRMEGRALPGDPESLLRLMFKAKGDKHRTAGTKEAVQAKPTVVAGVDEFVNLMLTEARLEQGLTVACQGVRDVKLTGKFLQWVSADVQKEAVDELSVSGLTWDQVKSAVQQKAREWFIRR